MLSSCATAFAMAVAPGLPMLLPCRLRRMAASNGGRRNIEYESRERAFWHGTTFHVTYSSSCKPPLCVIALAKASAPSLLMLLPPRLL